MIMKLKNKIHQGFFAHRIAVLLMSLTMPTINNYGQAATEAESISFQIDVSKKFQQIDGFGVNANTRSWDEKELVPALDLLLDSVNATVWRVIVESVEKWEDTNDNDDPFTFNWDYYNRLYKTPKFQKAWEMIGYLNEHGVTDKLIINFMGFAPQWMGNKVIDPAYEDEFVEMIVSFFHYAIKTRHLRFGLIAPTNESEHHKYSEGPHLTAEQHARILRKLIDRMETLGIMGDIRIVAPDNANTEIALKEFIPAMMKDPVVMSKIAHLGFHSYGGYFPRLKEWLQNSAYPKSTFWFTEWNAWCNGCDEGILGEYNYAFASKAMGFLLDLLKNGASAAIAWEAYDSYYEHHAPSPFSYWGILAYEPKTRTYYPRKNFYALQQVSRFVLPGAWQVSASTKGDSLTVAAFYHPQSETISIVGINRKKSPLTLNGSVKGVPRVRKLEMYHTDNIENVHHDSSVNVRSGSFKVIVPADCIFTLTGPAQN